jgi:parvulin-like peptidyl-prolyl isomerase
LEKNTPTRVLTWTVPYLVNRLVRTPVKHALHLRLPAAASVLILGLALARAQTPAPAPSRADREVIAVVDGIPISQLQYDRLAEPYFAEIEAKAGRKLTEDEKALLRKNVMSELIRERLWVADAKRRGFTATEAELDARLQRNDYFKTNGKFDPVKFRQFKFSPASNYREIADQVRNAVLLDKYVAWMRTRYAVPERELRREFEERTAQASIRFLWLGPDQVSLEPQATAAQIRAYYESHPDEFQSAEDARLTYIRVPIEVHGAMPDSLRAAAENVARINASTLLSSLQAGRPAEPLAKSYGGLKDTGVFRVGEPVRGLGRSDALEEAVRAAKTRQWLPEPIRIGPNFVVARVEEHRMPKTRPLREVSALAKNRADAALRETRVDSLARIDYVLRPERYRLPLLRAAIVSRATESFADSRPVSERDVARTLERLRKNAGVPDTARAWADSIVKTLPDLVRKERQLEVAFKTMAEAAGRLRNGDRPEEVGRRFNATHYEVSIYQGQPPAEPVLLEGSLLDSLYKATPGTVAGPRVLRDSVFVARVAEVNDRFQPPYEAVRVMAHSEVEVKRRADVEKDARAYFETHRDQYRTPHRWGFDYVFFTKMKPDSAPVPEDSIRAYYGGHSLEFTIPARAHVRHILITVPSGRAADKNAARTKAAGILKRVKAGEDFEALAKEFSQDRGSAPRGGDLGEITRGEVVKEFGDAVFAMKPGEVSNVVETRFGYHVIRLESLTPQRLRSLDESRAEIRGVLGESLADSLAARQAAAFATEASRRGASFEELAKAHGGARSATPIGRLEPLPGVGEIPNLETAIGSLPEGGVSRPIPVENGFLVARLRRSIPPEAAPFAEVKDEVIRGMQAERKRAVADSVDTVLQRELRSGKDLETLALPFGGLRMSRFFPRRGPVPELARDTLLARDSTLYNEVFRSRPGSVLRPHPGAIGTLYAVVDSVKVLDRKQFAEHKKALGDELFEQRTAAWTERLRARAKIEIYRKDLKL